MNLIFKPYSLEFKHPFGVSSNTRTHTPAVFIRIEHNQFYGYGEACLPKYLGENTEDTMAFLEKAAKMFQSVAFPFDVSEVFKKMDDLSENNNAAKASVDMAIWDLAGKISGKPFYELQGFGKSDPSITSCTIGIDDEKMMERKIEEARDFAVLKVKAGTQNDKALINMIRRYTDKPLYVDVNQGWADKYFVVEMTGWMKEKNVLLVEQPMPVKMVDEMAWVTERSELPTIADESVKRLKDIDKIKDVFSGINIKLMKSAGLTEAFEMIKSARQNNLKVMLGCMAESSCACSAMAQFMKLADYIDLDSPNLIVNDPFEGIKYQKGKIILSETPGTGVRLKEELLKF